ncbi:hypothetical protein [Aquimarina sp. AU474]|uniref:hypothetical protein n=1 Tax=Aquimarina sp. AU474 TaxID=2108529 RepID=UPI000D69BD6F|nr:hypothetical protein [Aquimarina sp. AU474]
MNKIVLTYLFSLCTLMQFIDGQQQVYTNTYPPSQGFLIGNDNFFEYVVIPVANRNSIIGKQRINMSGPKQIFAEMEEFDEHNKLAILKLNKKIRARNLNYEVNDSSKAITIVYIDKNGEYVSQHMKGEVINLNQVHLKLKNDIEIDSIPLGSVVYNRGSLIGVINAIYPIKNELNLIEISQFNKTISDFLEEKKPNELVINYNTIDTSLKLSLKTKHKGVSIYFGGIKKHLDVIKTIRYGFDRNDLAIRLNPNFIKNKTNYFFPTPKNSKIYFQVETIDGHKGSIIGINTISSISKIRVTDLNIAYNLLFKCTKVNSQIQAQRIRNNIIRRDIMSKVPCVVCQSVNSWNSRELSNTDYTPIELQNLLRQIKKIKYKPNDAEEYVVSEVFFQNHKSDNAFWYTNLDKNTKKVLFELLLEDLTNTPLFLEYVNNGY